MAALTARLLDSLYGPGFPALSAPEEDPVPANMTAEAVAQTWYRMLHTLGRWGWGGCDGDGAPGGHGVKGSYLDKPEMNKLRLGDDC